MIRFGHFQKNYPICDSISIFKNLRFDSMIWFGKFWNLRFDRDSVWTILKFKIRIVTRFGLAEFKS